MKAVSTLLCILLSISIFSVRVECLCPDKISNLVRWSQWKDAPTNAGARVNIGASAAVLLDVSPPVIEHIDVYGTLVFDPAVPAINLTVGSVYVRKGGKMYLGSSECPMSNSVTINIKGSPKPDVDPDGLGTKVLGVFEGGLLEIHGKPRQPVWTVLSSTASINSTKISLAENVDWAIGERIVIATTDFEIFNDELGAPVTQNEEVTITARPSDKEVEFTPQLKYLHYGNIWTGENGDKIDMRAEVGLINRNILIQGDLSADLSGDSLAKEWGGHVMIRDGGVARIEYMEITKVGQRGEFGRYPLHFHNASTQPDSYLRGNSIHDTFQRCIVVHSTFNLRIQNNFAYRGKGHCYFIEDGNEEQNVFDHNLGIRPLVLSGALLDSDLEPAVFWTTNPLNHFYRNVAVGGKMGFWFAMPVSPLALSADQTGNRLRHKVNGDFVGNKAHSGNVGLFVDRGQMNAKPGSVTQQTDYFPTNLTAAVALSEQLGKPIDLKSLDSYTLMSYGSRVPARFVDFTAYKSREEGMWGRGSYMHSYGARLADNIVGCIWPGFANLMQDTVIVGETDNVGTFNNVPMYQWWGDEEGRTRPVKSFLHSPILGYSSYDASGGDLAIDIRFHNFNDFTFTKGSNAGKVRKSGALTGLTGPNVIEPGNRIYRAKFYNVKNRVYFREYLPWRPNLATVDDAVKGIVWVDADGSILAGLPEAGCGKTIVGSGPHVRTAGCVQKSDWNAWICNANTNAHRAFYISQSSTTNTVLNATEIRTAFDVHLTKLSDGATVDIEPNLRSSGSSYTASLSYGTNIVVNNNYYLSLGNKNTFLSAFAISVHDMDVKEKVRFAVPFSGSNTPVVKYGYQGANPATEVSSYDNLVMNSYYFNKAENLLWVQLGVSSVDYDYHYDLPFVDSYAEMSVSSDCSANADKLCSYPARGTPSNPGNIPTVAVNLCETSGAITGGVTSYTVKTSDTYVVFDDKYADGWEKNTRCNISSELTYEGTAALRCIYPRYEYSSIYRVWDQTALDTSKFTHIQLAARSAPGHGNAELSLNMFNQSWTHFSAASVQSPFYTHNAGPITDDKWSVVTIPIADFKLPKSGIWGISLSLSAARPMQFYVDSIKFVSLNSQKTAIANYPPAPAKVSLVGPGPSDSYGTDPPVDDNPSATNGGTTGASTGSTTAAGDNLDSGASRSLYALFSVVVFVILTLL